MFDDKPSDFNFCASICVQGKYRKRMCANVSTFMCEYLMCVLSQNCQNETSIFPDITPSLGKRIFVIR